MSVCRQRVTFLSLLSKPALIPLHPSIIVLSIHNKYRRHVSCPPPRAPTIQCRYQSHDTHRSSPESIKSYTYEQVQSITTHPNSKPHPLLIDVREPSELQATGHIPTAQNVPITTAPEAFHLPSEEFEDRFGFSMPEKTSDVPLVFYCKAGVRSGTAARLAQDAGWKDVGSYAGSWIDWVERGGKVER